MSIAIALIGKNCSVVATDSQTIDSMGNITSLDFDKTFKLFNDLVAIAQVGIIDINGQYIKDLVANIFVNQPNPTSLGSVVQTIKKGLTDWLIQNFRNIPDNLNRGVELLLVGKEYLSHGIYKIYTIDIKEKNKLVGDYYVKSKSFKGNYFAHAGDDIARLAINAFLIKENFSNLNYTKLNSLAKTTIQIGISKSGYLVDFPNTKSCGGNAMVKHV